MGKFIPLHTNYSFQALKNLLFRLYTHFMPKLDPYFVHWNNSPYLKKFVHYLQEFGALKFPEIRPHSLDMHYNEGIEFNFVIGGTYKWIVEEQSFQIFPEEGFITCPWQWHGSPNEVLDRGVLSWMILQPKSYTKEGALNLGEWSSLSHETQQEIGKLFAENKNPIIPKGTRMIELFREINKELIYQELGYIERINILLDSLLLSVARSIKNRKINKNRDDDFIKRLTTVMTRYFHHKVSMADIAYSFDMSSTSFNNKVKEITGFSPADYMIELKMNAAKDMLINSSIKITTLALECGFYSSQHFSTQFTQRTGMTPSQFRKKIK